MKYILLFNAFLFTLISVAQGPSASMSNDAVSLAQGISFQEAQKASFEENKGQVTGEDASKVKYTFNTKGMKVFLLNDGIAYQFSKTHYPKGYNHPDKFTKPEVKEAMDLLAKDIREETYRMDVRLIGANLNTTVTAEGKSSDYVQYYNHNTLNVHSYTKVTYHNVYPNIDWVIYQKGEGIKYDFVVRPGGDPKQIKLETKWVEDLSVDDKGNLVLKNRMGGVSEQTPVSFQNGKEIQTRFDLKDNELTFDIKNYNPSEVLIIDPLVRSWGTYYGGENSDYGYSCATDAFGNVYLAGRTNSTSSIASGGHQNVYSGVSIAFLVKFNSTGVRQWGTYYGSLWTIGNSCSTDAYGNVYLAGETGDPASIIASGGHQNILGGGSDAFLVKFNSLGVRQWGTYYGGLGYDMSTSCATDTSGNVFLAGYTTSTSSMASGGHQNILGGGIDAFLIKFDSLGVRQWGTFYGGSDDDIGYSCAVDTSGNVYLSGTTNSTSSIASGGHQNVYGGGAIDAFLVKFNSTGVRQWGSYYGGSITDYCYSCATDGSGSVYLAGNTSSTTSIASGGHQNTLAGSDDAFLVKFDSSGFRQWGTYYGGGLFDYGRSCTTDGSGNVYLAGNTSSSSLIACQGYQNVYAGNDDAYLVEFNSSGVRKWGTYYGDGGLDYGFSCAIDVSGDIYMAGLTPSSTSFASGGHQNVYGGGSGDAFLVKFLRFISDTNTTSASTICDNETKTLTSSNSGSGTWAIVSGSGTIIGSTFTPSAAGSVTISYTDGCGTSTNVTFMVSESSIAPTGISGTTTICPGSSTTLTLSGGSAGTGAIAEWYTGSCGGTAAGTGASIVVSPTSNTTYFVRYNGTCNTTICASQLVTVQDTIAPVFVEDLPADTTVNCDAIPTAVVLTATDNCTLIPDVVFVEDTTTGSCANSYTLTRTWTATDERSNITTHIQIVTVQDTVAPIFVEAFPADTTVNCDAVPIAVVLTATDNCTLIPDVVFAEDTTTGSCANSYTLTRTWTATDECSNITTHIQIVTVQDTVAPTFVEVLPSDTTVNCDAVPVALVLTATDNCTLIPDVVFEEDTTTGSCANSYTLTRTWTATDECSNVTTHIQIVTVQDTVAPTFVEALPSDTTVNCDAVPVPVILTATDNCSLIQNVVFAEDTTAGLCASSYTLTRSWTSTDECNNVAIHIQMVTVQDTVAPLITGCPSDISQNNDLDECGAIITWTAPTATDICSSNITITSSHEPNAQFAVGTTTVTYTATDECGNESTCSFDVIVTDVQKPNISVTIAPDFCWDEPVVWQEIISDNCAIASVASSHSMSYSFGVGNTVVTMVATDTQGNDSTYTFKVTVLPMPIASINDSLISSNQTICIGSKAEFSVNSPDPTNTYTWYFENTVVGSGLSYSISSATVNDAGIYTLEVVDAYGCLSVDTFMLYTKACDINIFESFSPNRDGKNEYFEVENIEGFPNTGVTIFNRWGAQVFQSENYKNDWDGTSQNRLNVNGDELPEGTYFYLLELGGDPADETYHKIYKGYVYLKR